MMGSIASSPIEKSIQIFNYGLIPSTPQLKQNQRKNIENHFYDKCYEFFYFYVPECKNIKYLAVMYDIISIHNDNI